MKPAKTEAGRNRKRNPAEIGRYRPKLKPVETEISRNAATETSQNKNPAAETETNKNWN